MNYSKMTKAQLIEIINGLQDELIHMERKTVVTKDTTLPWGEQPVIAQVQAMTTTHAETMRERMAAAKAAAMSSGRAVKA